MVGKELMKYKPCIIQFSYSSAINIKVLSMFQDYENYALLSVLQYYYVVILMILVWQAFIPALLLIRLYIHKYIYIYILQPLLECE